nr:hypothetical protein [Lysinibacillus telephonicus]
MSNLPVESVVCHPGIYSSCIPVHPGPVGVLGSSGEYANSSKLPLINATGAGHANGSGSGTGLGSTWIVIVDSFVPPNPSFIMTVNVSSPIKSLLGVYVHEPS